MSTELLTIRIVMAWLLTINQKKNYKPLKSAAEELLLCRSIFYSGAYSYGLTWPDPISHRGC